MTSNFRTLIEPNSYDPFWEGDRRLEIRQMRLARSKGKVRTAFLADPEGP